MLVRLTVPALPEIDDNPRDPVLFRGTFGVSHAYLYRATHSGTTQCPDSVTHVSSATKEVWPSLGCNLRTIATELRMA